MKPMDFSKINSVPGALRETPIQKSKEVSGTGPSFESTLKSLDSGAANPGVSSGGSLKSPEFDLRQNPALTTQGVKFSNHAVDRMMSRGIQFSKADIQKLNEVVDKAAAKGSRDSLVLMGDSALIVSVKNKTVVTVMDKANMKENVFTNIDSTIVM